MIEKLQELIDDYQFKAKCKVWNMKELISSFSSYEIWKWKYYRCLCDIETSIKKIIKNSIKGKEESVAEYLYSNERLRCFLYALIYIIEGAVKICYFCNVSYCSHIDYVHDFADFYCEHTFNKGGE